MLGGEHKKTIDSLSNMGSHLYHMKDYEGALDHYQEVRSVQEKVLEKTHPDTLTTIINMAGTYIKTENSTKVEETYRFALDGYEKSLGKDHQDTKDYVRGLNILLEDMRRLDEKTALEKICPESGL